MGTSCGFSQPDTVVYCTVGSITFSEGSLRQTFREFLGAGSRGGSSHLGGLGTKCGSESAILRSPENIADASDTNDGRGREYCPKINKIGKPTKNVTRLMGPADDVESLVDLKDSPPWPE
ncbi:hypothetical protein B9Z19DRAFT_1062455 [Tuber borchii]|uniref:Uncharacterized protein n=1 Tax=Tuber borchii TaxID=42251 RepID=A0A2T7A1J0_TUBBO|nr:hypothetical protein B9Z19DRAFT_1062455 [Tuber borchii]